MVIFSGSWFNLPLLAFQGRYIFTRMNDFFTAVCGHINPRKKQYLSYAYGPDWGKWNTAWHPVRF